MHILYYQKTRIMQSFTGSIGEQVSAPLIKTKSTVVEQIPGVLGDDTPILMVTYLMEYSSRYGYDVSDYPIYFRDYMNSEEMEEALSTIQDRLTFDDQFSVEDVGTTVCVPQVCTLETDDGNLPTTSPTERPSTASPAALPSQMPSTSPSAGAQNSPTALVIDTPEERNSFLAGIIVALIVVLLIAVIALLWHRRRNQRRRKEDGANGDSSNSAIDGKAQGGYDTPNNNNNNNGGAHPDQSETSWGAIAIPLGEDVNDAEAGTITTPETAKMTQQSSARDNSALAHSRAHSSNVTNDSAVTDSAQRGLSYHSYMTEESDVRLQATYDENISENDTPGNDAGEFSIPLHDQTAPSISQSLSPLANLMANRSGSFSTNSFDETLSSSSHYLRDGDDEFDKYKDEVLEKLRVEVEETIDGVEGMLSLAITNVFMDAEGAHLDLSWIGGEDLGSIEASCLCQTFEWARKTDSLTG